MYRSNSGKVSVLKLSPSALKAFLACPRSWFLSHVKRVPRDVPKYVLGGQDLDEAAEHYLAPPERAPKGRQLALRMVSDVTERELEAIKPLLPSPGTVHTQHTMRMPCPGVDGVELYGKADYMTPPSEFIVIGDVKRVWDKSAVMTVEQLTADVQLNMYAYLAWELYGPTTVTGVWTYCVRGTHPKGEAVYAPLSRDVVNTFMHDVAFPAARAMLDLVSEEADRVAHNPDSCNGGGDRCFVARHCRLYRGQIATGEDIMSKYRVRKVEVNPPTHNPDKQAMLDAQAQTDTVTWSQPQPEIALVTPDQFIDDLTAPPAPTTLELCTPAEAPDSPTVPLATATTEQIIAELKDRGYYGVELHS